MSEQTIKAELRSWIVQRSGGVRTEDIADDTPIIEQRIVSSLHAVELLVFIEALSGRRLRLEQVRPRALHSIDAIYANFFAEPAPCSKTA
jgi:acyl carrier protein